MVSSWHSGLEVSKVHDNPNECKFVLEINL